MSNNRDNFRANQPPSKVLHVRNLAPEATEADILELCRQFGKVLRIKITGPGTTKAQGFVEFDNIRSAIQMVSFFVGNSEPPRVCEKNVHLQYSTRNDIGGGVLAESIKLAAVTGPVLLVTFTCTNASTGPNLESIHTMFSSFGEVAKIAMSEAAQGGLQALIQFSDTAAATAAQAGLDNAAVPSYMAPDNPGPVAMRVAHSHHTDLALRYQSARAKDYTNPYLPFESTAPSAAELAAAVAARAALEGSGESSVLLAMIDDVQYTPTIDALAQVFTVYGPLAKMSLACRGGMWQALVQFKEAAAAATAKQYLDGYAMYPGGGNKIQLEFSMQRDLYIPHNDELGWDWTRPAAEAAAAAEAQEQAAAAMQAAEAKYRGGAFSVSVREVVSHYMALEEYYLDATTSMAIRIDALVPDALTSSMVDDAFYILKKCGGRALATGSVQCVAALLGGLNDALANAYRGALQARLSGGPSRLVAAAPQLPGSAPAMLDAAAAAAAAEHAVAINNADVSADYAAKLRHELEAVAERVFPGVGERERVRSVLSDLSKTGGDFRSLATRALEALSDALLPRLRGVLDEVGAASYLLGDSDYLQAETEDGWVGHLLAALDLQLRWLQPRLTPGAWEGLFHSLLDKLLARLEVLLSRKQFSQLGGLQLDRDVRALVAATGEMTQRTVRDKFARLTQVATVLSLESVQEFMDYWGDDAGHVTWRLTPAEVRAVLAQRTDFAKDVIMALPL